MADYTDIYSRYKNLYDSQNNALLQKKNAQVTGYQNNQNDINNQYAGIAKGLSDKSTALKANYGNAQSNLLSKYNNLYTGLDQQNAQAKTTNYTDRNNVDTGVNQNMARTQELMAKNGWSGGGENLQATLNSNSDRMNGFGKVDTTMGQTLQGVLNNRNTYKGNQTTEGNTLTADENNAQNDINTQSTANQVEQKTKIQQIMDAISQANTGYGADSNALRSGLDAQAGQEISGRQQQEIAYQRQQEAVKQQQAYETQQRAVAYQQQVQAQQVANQQAQRMASSRASVSASRGPTYAQQVAANKANATERQHQIDKAAIANFGSLDNSTDMYSLLSDKSFINDVSQKTYDSLQAKYQKELESSGGSQAFDYASQPAYDYRSQGTINYGRGR